MLGTFIQASDTPVQRKNLKPLLTKNLLQSGGMRPAAASARGGRGRVRQNPTIHFEETPAPRVPVHRLLRAGVGARGD